MSRVFMVFAASGENLFEARCGAKDFFDNVKAALKRRFYIAAKTTRLWQVYLLVPGRNYRPLVRSAQRR